MVRKRNFATDIGAITTDFCKTDEQATVNTSLAFPKRKGMSPSQAVDISEVGNWLDWMRREVPGTGMDLPTDEASVLLLCKALHLRSRVHHLCPHMPSSLETLFMEAGILHECWALHKRQSDTARAIKRKPRLAVRLATRFVQRWNADILMEASDGQHYVVKFPHSVRENMLATESITVELARGMGLPVPEACIIEVSSDLAATFGVVSRGWPRYLSTDRTFECLGLRAVDDFDITGKNWQPKKSSDDILFYLSGFLIFNILALNLVQEPPFHGMNDRGEPIFLYQNGSMLCANWSRFIRATHKDDWFPQPPAIANIVRSSEHLDHWIHRATDLDLNPIWGLTFRLPSTWYGGNHNLAASVLRKLETRVLELHESVRSLTQKGYFPNLGSLEGRASKRPVASTIGAEVRMPPDEEAI